MQHQQQTQPELERYWAMPNRWTFEIEPIQKLIHREMGDGLWIDPFAGKSDIADITNDIDPERETDFTKKATEFLRTFDTNEVNGGVLIDPPYSATQLKRKYSEIGMEPNRDETNPGFYGETKDEVARICKPGAKVLTFGWNSTGVGTGRGFKKKKIVMFCHGSSRNDTICVVENFVSEGATQLSNFP